HPPPLRTARLARVDDRRAVLDHRRPVRHHGRGHALHRMARTRMTEASSRIASLTSWHADWKGLRVAVLGLGATGFSVADTLAELGADVLVVTEKAPEEYARLLPVIGARLAETPLG